MKSFKNYQRRENELPRGLGVVLAKQTAGFWGRLDDGAAQPDFSKDDIPSLIYTFEPWLGCLWGTSCAFCYVPNLSAGHYPGRRGSHWFKDWGRWLVPKPEITQRLRHQLFDGDGRTRNTYRGAFVFMSAKTDPFLPAEELLAITRDNLRVLSEADVFLMCQTRSLKVVDDLEIFALLQDMGRRGKVAVSFSIGTDIQPEQQRIERGGLSPERRLETMRTLKDAGIFVSAAISPLMPYSVEFPNRLLDSAHHASVQALRPSGFGSATPKPVLEKVYRSVPDYKRLDTKLVGHLRRLDTVSHFSWGIGNKGFIGSFLAANRFYGSRNSQKNHRQLTFKDRQVEVSRVVNRLLLILWLAVADE